MRERTKTALSGRDRLKNSNRAHQWSLCTTQVLPCIPRVHVCISIIIDLNRYVKHIQMHMFAYRMLLRRYCSQNNTNCCFLVLNMFQCTLFRPVLNLQHPSLLSAVLRRSSLHPTQLIMFIKCYANKISIWRCKWTHCLIK